MLHTCQERLQSLSGKGSSSGIAHRNGEHQRHTDFSRFHRLFRRIDGSFGIERIKDGFYQECVHATLQKCLHLLHIGSHQFVVSEATQSRVVHIGRNAQRLVGWSYITQYKTRFHRSFSGVFISQLTGNPCTSQVHLTAILLHIIVSHRHSLRGESAGGDQVSPSFQILPVDVGNHVRTSQAKDVVVALHQSWHLFEPFASEVLLHKSVLLNHGAHRTVQHKYPLFDDVVYLHHSRFVFNL